MFDKLYIGDSVTSLDVGEESAGFSKVILQVSDDMEIVAGTDGGDVLTIACPWGTKEIAENILKRISGYQYQSYSATGAKVDPAAEIGDGISVGDIYSGVFSQNITFDSLMESEIEAPIDNEVDHEFPYVEKGQREIKRKFLDLNTSFEIRAGLIEAKVEAITEPGGILESMISQAADKILLSVNESEGTLAANWKSELELQSKRIDAKVSSSHTGNNFGWSLTDDEWKVSGNGIDVLKVSVSGAEITGKVTATSGKIGGFDILSDYLSYNNMTWGGTNRNGIYIGANGIQLGKNFRVDSAGNLYAASGTFDGTVYAGNIQYGGGAGTLSGSAISAGSIQNAQLSSGSVVSTTIRNGAVGTTQVSSGVSTALGYADFAHDVFGGNKTASYIYANAAKFLTLRIQETQASWQSVTVKDTSGNTRIIKYLGQ